ncbi:DUF3850 domain-containing protein [Aneurinibacillus aneurinilyticus]
MNDRGFSVGDELLLQEYEPKQQVYTGRHKKRTSQNDWPE